MQYIISESIFKQSMIIAYILSVTRVSIKCCTVDVDHKLYTIQNNIFICASMFSTAQQRFTMHNIINDGLERFLGGFFCAVRNEC